MQSPPLGKINVDHIAHFVPQREAARRALEQLGFRPTPFSFQQHRTRADVQLVPVGTGNHCVMLRAGYLEFLVPLAQSEVAQQLRRSIARYVGVHSIVFGTSDAATDYARLERNGFEPFDPIDLQRRLETEEGEGNACFTVVRVPPAKMTEGRMQFCRHHTQALVWQRRWLDHPNGVIALDGVLLAVEDLDEVCARYSRFTGIESSVTAARGVRRIATARGWVDFYDRETLFSELGISVPAMPFIAGCVLRVSDSVRTRKTLEENGLETRRVGDRIMVQGPPALGGNFVFASK